MGLLSSAEGRVSAKHNGEADCRQGSGDRPGYASHRGGDGLGQAAGVVEAVAITAGSDKDRICCKSPNSFSLEGVGGFF